MRSDTKKEKMILPSSYEASEAVSLVTSTLAFSPLALILPNTTCNALLQVIK